MRGICPTLLNCSFFICSSLVCFSLARCLRLFYAGQDDGREYRGHSRGRLCHTILVCPPQTQTLSILVWHRRPRRWLFCWVAFWVVLCTSAVELCNRHATHFSFENSPPILYPVFGLCREQALAQHAVGNRPTNQLRRRDPAAWEDSF
jgi:hypothetical protein